jgi:hypothetical protein
MDVSLSYLSDLSLVSVVIPSVEGTPWHDLVFKLAVTHSASRFVFIIFLYLDVVICAMEVQHRNDPGLMHTVKNI